MFWVSSCNSDDDWHTFIWDDALKRSLLLRFSVVLFSVSIFSNRIVFALLHFSVHCAVHEYEDTWSSLRVHIFLLSLFICIF